MRKTFEINHGVLLSLKTNSDCGAPDEKRINVQRYRWWKRFELWLEYQVDFLRLFSATFMDRRHQCLRWSESTRHRLRHFNDFLPTRSRALKMISLSSHLCLKRRKKAFSVHFALPFLPSFPFPRLWLRTKYFINEPINSQKSRT